MSFNRTCTIIAILITLAYRPTQVTAGIAVDQNGIVTSATLNDGTNDINVLFVNNTSFEDIKTNLENDAPWYNGPYYNPVKAWAMGSQLESELNSYLGILDITVTYSFIMNTNASLPPSVAIHEVFYDVGTDQWNETVGGARLTTESSSALFFAVPNTQAVPEPSTAIAMGLLGIVGFAGNRRRRRQESVA